MFLKQLSDSGVDPESSRLFQPQLKISGWILEFDVIILKIKKIAICLIEGLQYKKKKQLYQKYLEDWDCKLVYQLYYSFYKIQNKRALLIFNLHSCLNNNFI